MGPWRNGARPIGVLKIARACALAALQDRRRDQAVPPAHWSPDELEAGMPRPDRADDSDGRISSRVASSGRPPAGPCGGRRRPGRHANFFSGPVSPRRMAQQQRREGAAPLSTLRGGRGPGGEGSSLWPQRRWERSDSDRAGDGTPIERPLCGLYAYKRLHRTPSRFYTNERGDPRERERRWERSDRAGDGPPGGQRQRDMGMGRRLEVGRAVGGNAERPAAHGTAGGDAGGWPLAGRRAEGRLSAADLAVRPSESYGRPGRGPAGRPKAAAAGLGVRAQPAPAAARTAQQHSCRRSGSLSVRVAARPVRRGRSSEAAAGRALAVRVGQRAPKGSARLRPGGIGARGPTIGARIATRVWIGAIVGSTIGARGPKVQLGMQLGRGEGAWTRGARIPRASVDRHGPPPPPFRAKDSGEAHGRRAPSARPAIYIYIYMAGPIYVCVCVDSPPLSLLGLSRPVSGGPRHGGCCPRARLRPRRRASRARRSARRVCGPDPANTAPAGRQRLEGRARRPAAARRVRASTAGPCGRRATARRPGRRPSPRRRPWPLLTRSF
jgi:hypothetical protein